MNRLELSDSRRLISHFCATYGQVRFYDVMDNKPNVCMTQTHVYVNTRTPGYHIAYTVYASCLLY